MRIIGLTGGIACGKSTVSNILKEKGLPIVDLDELARVVVQPNKPAYNQLLHHFGQNILTRNGEIDREQLGKIVFNDAQARKKLNQSTHRYIFWELIKNLLYYAATGHRAVVIDAPLLFESGLHQLCSVVMVVYCDEQTQVQRLHTRNGYNEAEALSRIRSQMSLDEKRKRANIIIDNTSAIENTKQQVLRLLPPHSNALVPSLLQHVVWGVILPVAAVVAPPVTAYYALTPK